jgi:diguanylate cyclase (GGDEF)-like protein
MLAGDVVEESVSDPGMPAATRQSMLKWGEKSVLNVPLRTEDEPLGLMILIESERERRFADDERELAKALGEQAAGAMCNARLYRTVQAQLKVRHDLLTLSESLLSCLDAGSVFDRVAATLRSLVAYDSLTVGVLDSATDELHILFADGDDTEAMRDRRLPADRGVTGAVLQAGSAELVNDMLRDPRAHQITGTDEEEQASILAPIRLGARRAILTVDRYKGWRFQQDDLETVELFASIAAVALENASLYRVAEQQAISDGLTGLYNHRHFYERLGMELARARRSGQPLTLLMIDLDDFKQLNDEHGHPAGDEVLRTVGRILSEETRRGVDLPARYGGEEFAVFLPDTAAIPDAAGPARSAAAVAERLRSAVEQARIDWGEEEVRLELRTTVSIGLAVFPATAATMGELVAQADAALYLAKRRGKNRVEAYGLK